LLKPYEAEKMVDHNCFFASYLFQQYIYFCKDDTRETPAAFGDNTAAG
jgi:hypothetical protein